jgi:hypothetical protein
MQLVDQGLVDHGLGLPEHGRAGCGKHRERIDEPGIEQHAAAERAVALSQAANDAMIEGVDGVALGLGAGVQRPQQDGVEILLDALHLDPDVHAPEEGEHLAEEWHGFAVGQVMLLHGVEAEVTDAAEAFQHGAVVNDDGTIAGGVDVQLDAFGAQGPGAAERSTAVFVFVAGCTTVSDTQRSSHEFRMSGRMTIAAR